MFHREMRSCVLYASKNVICSAAVCSSHRNWVCYVVNDRMRFVGSYRRLNDISYFLPSYSVWTQGI